MADYKLTFLPSSDYVNRLLEARGATTPKIVMPSPTSNMPVGTVISGTDETFSVMMAQSGKKRSLNFYLHADDGNTLTKSIPLGRNENIDHIDLYEIDANKDGAIDLVAVAVDAKNNFISSAIAYSAGKDLPSFLF